MTTPTDGEWMSADEALAFLGTSHAEAVDTIRARAHNGLIKAKAERYIDDGGRSFDGVELPRQFWWSAREIDGNWRTGDLTTTSPDSGGHLQAFGVTFRRQDIEQMKPASTANPTPSPPPTQKPAGRTVFIGHGHSSEWRKLYLFLQNDHGLSVREYNSGSSPVGISTTDHLKDMLDHADLAFLILTGEDEQATGELNPRLNVVHEAGLFQGRLGFRKAILFLEEGCQEWSNIDGLTHLPFPKGKIEAQFHEATKVLKREKLIS
jgi:predicted nucleotide-binding protein